MICLNLTVCTAESQSLHRWLAMFSLFCHLLGQLLPLLSVQMEKHLHPQDHFIQTELKDIYFVSGDHTVKLIDCHIGKCLKVLSGHHNTN
jgi:activating molecule in BECN1-regulated autophagy protein 1